MVAVSELDTRINVYENQNILRSCYLSTYASMNWVFTWRVAKSKITIPAAGGDQQLIYQFTQYGGHCGPGTSTDYIYVSMLVKNETTGTIVAQTTELTCGRGPQNTANNIELKLVATAGSTYQLYFNVRSSTDDHLMAWFNGGILWVLPTTQTTAPTTGYLFYN